MFRKILAAAIMLLFLIPCVPAEAMTGSGQPPADGNTATEIFRYLSEKEKDFMFSPYSLKDAFSILYPAAGGETKEEIEKVFGFRNGETGCPEMDASMMFDGEKGIRAVNKAFVNTNHLVKEPNISALGTDNVDLSNFAETDPVAKINRHVEENTNGKIRDLLTADDVDSESTGAVLVNCLYFLMDWDHEKTDIWWNNDTIPAFRGDVPLTDVKEDGDIDILRLKYDKTEETGHEYSMYIICDSADSGSEKVSGYMQGLTDRRLAEILDFSAGEVLEGYDEASFDVPCFEMNGKYRLKEVLSGRLGMKTAFDPDLCDFEKFYPVCIDDVIQGTFVKVNEKGTEAAAATAIIMVKTTSFGGHRRIKEVIADSPFAFAIKDDTADEILFLGMISDPQYKEAEEQ